MGLWPNRNSWSVGLLLIIEQYYLTTQQPICIMGTRILVGQKDHHKLYGGSMGIVVNRQSPKKASGYLTSKIISTSLLIL